MLSTLAIKNFKSWEDTGEIELGSITGLFGTNSSGKSSLLQFLLALKQTTESSDRTRVFHLGDQTTYVNLDTFHDVMFNHDVNRALSFEINWTLAPGEPQTMTAQSRFGTPKNDRIKFGAAIRQTETNGLPSKIFVEQFGYQHGDMTAGLEKSPTAADEYSLVAEGFTPKRQQGKPWPLPNATRFYGFPNELYAYYQNVDFLSDYPLALENLMKRVFYLGPLRDYPQPSYTWSGETPQGVGRKGEYSIPALLASRALGMKVSKGSGRSKKSVSVETRIAEWLKAMDMIDSFSLEPVAPNRRDYEVKIKRTATSAEALITEMGFGISQILPVLVLCYYAPENSILLFEQPEIHLHPYVQYWLADVFIDVMRYRKTQIILESHSEYLLNRLLRRMAEDQSGKLAQQTKLYFTEMSGDHSVIQPLVHDEFGNIQNWPKNFFGDLMGEVSARTLAAIDRELKAGK